MSFDYYCLFLLMHMCVHFSNIHPKLLGYRLQCQLYWIMPTYFLKWLEQFTYSASTQFNGSSSSRNFNIWYFSYFNFSHSDIRLYSIMFLICNFLIINVISHFFVCVLVMLKISLGKCLFRSFAHFTIGLSFLFINSQETKTLFSI